MTTEISVMYGSEKVKIKSKKNSKKYITNNRPTNLFCTANIVENLFIVTNNNNILTLKPLNYIIEIFTHLELCLTSMTHNFK